MSKELHNPVTKLSVLFVDDDPVAHLLIDDYLAGRKVHHAYSAEDALILVEKENIPIVITDIYMEKMDGIELTRKIKKNRSTHQVIIITGDSETINLLNALDAGANDFLVKPLKKEKLLEAVDSTEAKIQRWKDALKDLFSKKREGEE
ncbi:MAG: response regulator [Deltaproteobacteria bacterium]|nr:response regulator [Deltaproteobacteria bacterium]